MTLYLAGISILSENLMMKVRVRNRNCINDIGIDCLEVRDHPVYSRGS